MKLSVIKSKSCERERNSVSVPCKLNNVKTNYNTLDILKCLSLESCKRILSQRKFLSIFAKTNLFKNLI